MDESKPLENRHLFRYYNVDIMITSTEIFECQIRRYGDRDASDRDHGNGDHGCSITADWPDSLDDARIDTAHRIGPELEDGRPDGVLEVGAGLVVDDFVWWDVDSRSRAAWMTFGWPSDDLRMAFG